MVLLLIGWTAKGYAQPEKGLHELMVDASVIDSGGDLGGESVVDVSIGYGYFLNDMFEIIGNLGLQKTSSSDPSYVIGVGPYLNFKLADYDETVPYVGITLGTGKLEDNTILMFHAEGGVRIFSAGGGGSINLSPFYQYQSIDVGRGDDLTLTITGVSVGLSVYF